MRILFINPPNTPFTSKGLIIEPIDILGLATFLKVNKHDVSVLDMDAKRIKSEKIDKYLSDGKFDAIVVFSDYHIPLHTDLVINEMLLLSHIAKKHNIKVVFGGKNAASKAEELLKKNNTIDVIILGEAEQLLKELFELRDWNNIDELKNISGISFLNRDVVVNTKARTIKDDINNFPIADRELVDLDDYIDVRTLLSSRGCVQRCAFCHVPGFWGVWRGRSSEKIVKEIEYLVKKCNAKKILFLDDNAMVDNERMKEISREIIKKQLKVSLGCLGSMQYFDEETFRLMRQAGFCWIHYGIESGDDGVLKAIGKNINLSKIKEVISVTKKIGMRIRTSWILDLPGSTPQALDNTINTILELETDEIRLHFFALRYGSKYHDSYSKKYKNIKQYMHNDGPNVQLTDISEDYLNEKVDYLVCELKKRGYLIIKNPEDFNDLNLLKEQKNIKIASFCPLRYALDWDL